MEFSSAIYRGDPCPEFSFSFKLSMWKKIYLLLKKILFRMVEDMCTRFNIIWSGARNTGRKFWPMM